MEFEKLKKLHGRVLKIEPCPLTRTGRLSVRTQHNQWKAMLSSSSLVVLTSVATAHHFVVKVERIPQLPAAGPAPSGLSADSRRSPGQPGTAPSQPRPRRQRTVDPHRRRLGGVGLAIATGAVQDPAATPARPYSKCYHAAGAAPESRGTMSPEIHAKHKAEMAFFAAEFS